MYYTCSGYYRQLIGKDENAEHLDYVYSADYNDVITEAITDIDSDPKSLSEAQAHNDWPCWKEAMDQEITMLK
jgi:hypothetical protein